MKTEAETIRIDRAKLTSRLKEICEAHDAYKKQANATRAELFMLSYQWVEATAAEDAVTQVAAIVRLAKMVKRKEHTVYGWYGCGKLMRQEGIDYRKCIATSVATLFNTSRSCPDATHRAAVLLIRTGKGTDAVKRLLAKDKVLAEVRAERKARKLEKNNALNVTRVKMEMIALRTLAEQFYGKAIIVSLFDEEDKELLTVR